MNTPTQMWRKAARRNIDESAEDKAEDKARTGTVRRRAQDAEVAFGLETELVQQVPPPARPETLEPRELVAGHKVKI